jgi:hypothetical protein
MSIRTARLISRFLALSVVIGAVTVGLLVGGRRGLVAGVFVFAVVGPLLHVVAGSAVSRSARLRTGGSRYAGLPLQVAGVAYPTLVWIALAVQVWRTTSVPLAVLMLVATPIWPTFVVRLADPTRRAASRSKAVAVRQAYAEHNDWRFAADGRGWLPHRWTSGGSPLRSAYTPSAVLGNEIEGYEVVAFDGYATSFDDDVLRLERTVTWMVLLPVELPDTCVVPWMSGGRAPTNPAELDALAHRDPEGVLVSSTFLGVARTMAPWRPLVRSAADITEAHLIADSADVELAWSVLTPEVRRTTAAGGLVGWRLAGRELYLTRAAAGPVPTADLVATAGWMVALARAVQAAVADRFPPDPQY